VLRFWNMSSTEQCPATDQVEFSFDRYEPLGRLMGTDDLEFLRSQSGFRPDMEKRFNRDRRRLCRLYLQQLSGEFKRLHAHARAMVASLPAEDSHLVGVLLRQQLRFRYELTMVQLRLSLGMGAIDARGLINAVRVMHEVVGQMAAPVPA
jgi:hypothetical protein